MHEKMEESMKESTKMIKNMDTGSICGLMEENMKGIERMENNMAKDG